MSIFSQFIIYIVFLLAASQEAFADEYLKYEGYPAMVAKLEKNCKNYAKDNDYVGKKERDASETVIDILEYYDFNQIEKVSSSNSRECNIARAETTIEGMSFLLRNRPENSAFYNDANNAMAMSFLTLWLLESPRNSLYLSQAAQYADLYVAKHDDLGIDDLKENAGYYFLSFNILELARKLEANDADTLKLAYLAEHYARLGWNLSKKQSPFDGALSQALLIMAQNMRETEEQGLILSELNALVSKNNDYTRVRGGVLYIKRKDFGNAKMWLESTDRSVQAFDICLLFPKPTEIQRLFEKEEQQSWLIQYRVDVCQRGQTKIKNELIMFQKMLKRAKTKHEKQLAALYIKYTLEQQSLLNE